MPLRETNHKKIGKSFWICIGVLIGATGAISLVFLIYIITCASYQNIEVMPECTPFTPGNWFDLFIGLSGLSTAGLLTWWANVKKCVKEKFFVALLAFLGFIMYGIVTYDIKKQECKAGYYYEDSNNSPK